MTNLPSKVDIHNLIEFLRIISWEAADIFIHYSQILKESAYNKNIMINSNEDDPVTKVDLKVNELIIKRINDKYKNVNWGILSEENTKISRDPSIRKFDWLWILDPLDGTKDFIQGTGNYAMHLALNYKNKTFLGIVLIPEMNQLWISDGQKIWGEQRDGSRLQINLGSVKELENMTIVTSKNHKNKILENILNKINFKKSISMGSIGCKVASIIRGESDIYLSLSLPGKSSPKDWDFAAPEAILRAAGGAITDLNNQRLIYNQENFEQKGFIIASKDKHNHGEICLQLKKLIEENDLYDI